MTNRKISEFTALTAPASTDTLPIIDQSASGTEKNKKISYSNLLSNAPAGSTSLPSFAFTGDPNTGFTSAGADALQLVTAGAARLTINSSGLVTVSENLTITGDLTVNGTTTTIDTTTLVVEDKNIEIGKVASPSDTTADGGGLTLKGATDKTFNWVNSTDSWTSSEHFSVSAQKEIRYLDSDSSHYVGFKSPATVTSNVVWTLPATDTGVSGYVLASDGSGNMSWVAPGSTASPDFSGNVTLTNDGNIRGFASLVATYTGSVKTFTVTVASKTAAHRYNGSGSSNGYKIDTKEAPFITLTPGRTYKFDQADGSNSGHPLLFYLDSGKTTAYTTGVTTSGTPGSSGAYTQIVVSDTTPTVLHYQCSSHSLMGNAVQMNSATTLASGLFGGTLASGITASSLTSVGTLTALTTSGDISMTGTGAIDVAAGTTAQRPGSASAGMFRFNSQTTEFEGYDGSAWGEIGGSAATGTADLLDIASSSGTGGGSATFNGSAYRFKLVTKGTSTAVTPSNAEILRVSINGVMQQPNDGTGQGDMTEGYVVSGTDIIFDSAPPNGATYFIVNMGATIAIGTPGDNTVTSAKIVNGTIIGTDLATNIDLGDNQKIRFGAGNDLEIYHSNADSIINDAGTGSLKLQLGGATKAEVVSGGFTITGTCTATAFAGDGSALTGISAGATGGGSDEVFVETGQTVTTSYSLTANKNAVTISPSINSGVTITVPSGATLVIL